MLGGPCRSGYLSSRISSIEWKPSFSHSAFGRVAIAPSENNTLARSLCNAS